MAEAPLWTANEVVEAVSGKCVSLDWNVDGVSIDSRSIDKNDLFIAIVGPTNDGHDYVKTAFENGASAALVSRMPDGCAETNNLIFVDDTKTGMERLGLAARARCHAKIIAVTGSVGKTGTKEALAHVLKEQGRTHYSVGSFNNHWGVPLSLARMPRHSDFAIFELGMNHAGELGPLSRMVRPHVAIITTVAAAHLEFFKGTAEIAAAKAEIFEGLCATGVALINADNEYCDFLMTRAQGAGVQNIVCFGRSEQAAARLEKITILPQSSEISAIINGQKLTFNLSVPGEHWAMNIMAVLGAVDAVDANLDEAARALSTLTPPTGRGVQISAKCFGGIFTIIDESYNASPIAMQAAFKVLENMTASKAGRKIVVLGDMRELGEKSEEIHASLAKDVSGGSIDIVYVCGPNMRHLFDALPAAMESAYANSSEDLEPLILSAVQPDDIVLIKGSLGSKMKVILKALLADASGQVTANTAGVSSNVI